MSFNNLPDLGPAFTPAGEAYSLWAIAESRKATDQMRVEFDIPFGTDAFQKLDLWLPKETGTGPLPVLVYVHGGGWTRGYKEWNGFMMERIGKIPALMVCPNHRLAPDARYPKPLDDVITALSWVYRNIGAYGGDTDRISIGGHSSGGHLAALAAVRPDLLAASGLPADLIKACFPLSAPLDLRLDHCEPGGMREKLIRKFLAHDGQDREASVPEYGAQMVVPTLLAWGSEDFAEIQEHNKLMVEVMHKNRNCVFDPRVIEGATHTGTHKVFLEPANAYVETMCAWIAKAPKIAGV
jgi:arylformamidase